MPFSYQFDFAYEQDVQVCFLTTPPRNSDDPIRELYLDHDEWVAMERPLRLNVSITLP